MLSLISRGFSCNLLIRISHPTPMVTSCTDWRSDEFVLREDITDVKQWLWQKPGTHKSISCLHALAHGLHINATKSRSVQLRRLTEPEAQLGLIGGKPGNFCKSTKRLASRVRLNHSFSYQREGLICLREGACSFGYIHASSQPKTNFRRFVGTMPSERTLWKQMDFAAFGKARGLPACVCLM